MLKEREVPRSELLLFAALERRFLDEMASIVMAAARVGFGASGARPAGHPRPIAPRPHLDEVHKLCTSSDGEGG